MSNLVKKLVTKEDPLFVHKALGILALASYAWRLPKVLPYSSDMRFASDPEWTVLTIFLHLCLNLSSFEFHIPSLRIKSDGGRIWSEYRLHSLIFGGRCLVCMAINFYEDYYRLEPNYRLNYIAVIMTMLAADFVSASVPHHSSTVQDLKASPGARYFFSVMQFFATSAALFGHDRRYSLFFYNLFVVQFTPFLMTLRRKNLVSHNLSVFLYGLMLVYGIFVGLASVRYDLGILRLVACLAAFWRMGPLPMKNKYFIWTVMHLLLEGLFRPVLEKDPFALVSSSFLMDASDCMTLVVLLHGIYTHYSKSKKSEPTQI